jgi:hypothetical protein
MIIQRSLHVLAVSLFLDLLFVGAGCCGSGVDLEALEMVVDATEAASEEQRLNMAASGFAAVAEEGGWKTGTCADAWRAYGTASMETRQALFAEAIEGCKAMCPAKAGTKAEVLAALASASPRDKTRIVVGACDVEGSEPVFTGDLEARRGQMELMEFWVFRSALDETFRRLDRDGSEKAQELRGRYEELARSLGRGLVLGLPPQDPDLEVPDSTSPKAAPLAPSVQVSRSAIGVDGVEVVALGPEGRIPGHLRGKPITPLTDALVPLAEQAVAEREARENRSEGESAPGEPGSNPQAGEGAKAPREEGKVGKKEAKLKRAKGSKVQMAKETMDRQIAESAGILADLNRMEAGSGVFGTGISGSRSETSTALQVPPPQLTDAARLEGRKLVVQCDRSLRYSLVYDALHSAYQSGFGEIHLGVWNDDRGRQTVVDASLGVWNPDWAGDPDEKPPLFLTVVITERGFHVRGKAAILSTDRAPRTWEKEEPTIPATGDVYPFEKLTDLIVKVKAEYPDEQSVVIAAAPRVRYDVLVGTADAVREHLPEGAERPEPLFPYLSLADPDAAHAFWKARAERSSRRSGRETRGVSLADLGTGYGSGGGYFGRKSTGSRGMSTGDPIILGALDQSVIDKEIKKHLSQIRYCYQKELNKNPALYGKIVVKFVIAKDGSVSSAKTNTTSMNNPIVENCVCQRFMRFQFPEPKGGGIVIVSYPFVFRAD